MHKTRTDLFGNAPAHVQRQLHDLRLRLKAQEDERAAALRRTRALQAAEQRESWEEIKAVTHRITK